MKKVTILALHLGYGGIEKCISTLANTLIDDYKVEIISTYKLYEEPIFEIDKRVDIKYLIENLKPNKHEIKNFLKEFKIISLSKEITKSIKILKLKRKKMIEAIKKCDSEIIISTRDIHNLWLGKYGKNSSLKIGWEHNHHNNDKKYIKKIIKSVDKLDYFVLVSKDLKDFYKDKINKNCKAIYIPNSLDYYPNEISNLKEENIISVGRLSIEKGFLDLIDVFNLVHQLYPNWHLNIVGDGPEYEKIKNKINNLKLNNSITLHGFQNKNYINKLLKKSSIYVMPSYTESFGIVLLEAFSFGIPCVAFNSAQGACELISNNWDGYLIDNRDKKQMAKRICELINNQNRRIIMGNNGIKKAKKFSIEEIRKKWIEIIK